ncbi:MAG: flagellar biosynthetic protein FliR [Lachnospiraceae bacterium]|nr:flagellar biosynthetic protein FliR [Lachnospiraceae bacterium]
MVNYSFDFIKLEYFLLILVRIACFVYTAPFYGRRDVPGRVKAGLAAFLAILIYFTIPLEEATYTSEIGYAILVLREGITGLLIGFAANICSSIILFAGTIIDMDIGISMAAVFDPATGSQVALTGNMYNYFLLLLMITSNMYQYILRAFIDSFSLIPLGGAVFDMNSLLGSMTKYMADLFIIAFRIVLPVFACIMILNAILGVMAKVAPQMNMFAVGIQLKLLVGLAVLFITVFMLPDIANFVFKEMRTLMIEFTKGMY